MLLLCIGPDTFRAQAKAQELERAFREKFDPNGSSVETLPAGKDAWAGIMERINTPSLFSPRRFLRTRDLLANLTKAQLESLARALTSDPEQIILVSVEEDQLPAKVSEALSKVPKLISYDFPLLKGESFRQWLQTIAKTLAINNETIVDQIAEAADGDGWLAWNELMKVSAGGQTFLAPSSMEKTIFEQADAFLREVKSFDYLAETESDFGSVAATFLSQTRAAIRVRDGATDGLHPFVIKKLQHTPPSPLESSLAVLIQAMISQRSGLGDGTEVLSLIAERK